MSSTSLISIFTRNPAIRSYNRGAPMTSSVPQLGYICLIRQAGSVQKFIENSHGTSKPRSTYSVIPVFVRAEEGRNPELTKRIRIGFDLRENLARVESYKFVGRADWRI
jgi:hypothetical protein